MNRQQSPYGPPALKDGGIVTKGKKRHSQGDVLLRTVLRLLQMLFYEKSIGLGIKCPGQYLLPQKYIIFQKPLDILQNL
jgi:hypothetical protein